MKLEPESILRWSNPVSGTVHGEVFVWTHNGCPQVVASIYHYYSPRRYLATEFHSLARTQLSATYKSQPVWSASSAGIAFKKIPGALVPANMASTRLRHMRAMARSFIVEFTNPKDEKERLRLLPQPSFRYKSTDPDVLDGSLFIFAQGTNPEAILIIEARRIKGDYLWQFALARQTGYRLDAFYKDRHVWSVPTALGNEKLKRTGPYTVFYHYPQAETDS